MPDRLREFRTEHSQFAFRKCPITSIHDRYVCTDTSLVLLGHGIKDIGSKESFIVNLDRSIAGGVIDSVLSGFAERWATADEL